MSRKIGRMAKEEKQLNVYLKRNLNWEQYKAEQRDLMAKRRKDGKTQEAQRSYVARNANALSMYSSLMTLEPALRRKGIKGYNCGR